MTRGDGQCGRPPPFWARLDAALALGDEADAEQTDAEKGERSWLGNADSGDVHVSG